MVEQAVGPAISTPGLRIAPILSGLLAVFLALSVLNNAILPAFEAADEGDHFAYAVLLAQTRRLPDLARDLARSHEITQPPLYYALTAALLAPLDLSNLPAIRNLNPDWFDPDVNADHRSVLNQYRHTSAESFPWHGAALALHVARLFSALLGALTVLLVYATVRYLAPASDRWTPLLATALVALNPKFIHIASIVNNDIAITCMATLACWWMVRMVVRAGKCSDRSSSLSFLVLGAWIGLATLCKISGLGLLAPAGVVVLITARQRHVRLQHTLARSAVTAVGSALSLVAGWIIIAGPWFTYNGVRYGHPLAWAQVQAANQSLLRPVPLNLLQMIGSIPEVLVSYWSVIGIELRYPAWVNAIFVVGLALAIIGCVWVAIRTLHAYRSAQFSGPGVAYLVLLVWELTLLASFALWLRDYIGTENSRLIFPGISLVAMLIATGWLALVGEHTRWRGRVAVGACILLGALSAATPFWLIQPAFASPVYLTAQERAALPGQTGASFNGQIGLQHAQIEPRSIEPGQSVHVSVYWGALQPLKQSYHTVLIARNSQGVLIGRLEAIPFGGRFDTQRWTPGEIFRDDYELPIDAGAQRGAATVELSVRGVYANPPLLEVDGARTSNFVVGAIKLLGPLVQVSAPQHPLIATFANASGPIIQLDGYDLQPQGSDGARLLSLHWRCVQSPDQDYTLFVHALNGDGMIISQEDAPPQNGAYPTRMWDAGEQILDLRTLRLPVAAVSLRLGWYPSRDIHGARLVAQKPGGVAWPDNAVVILLPAAGAP